MLCCSQGCCVSPLATAAWDVYQDLKEKKKENYLMWMRDTEREGRHSVENQSEGCDVGCLFHIEFWEPERGALKIWVVLVADQRGEESSRKITWEREVGEYSMILGKTALEGFFLLRALIDLIDFVFLLQLDFCSDEMISCVWCKLFICIYAMFSLTCVINVSPCVKEICRVLWAGSLWSSSFDFVWELDSHAHQACVH